MMPRIIIVDEKDNIIGYKDRKDRLDTDIIRCAGLVVYNSKDELLLAQRVHTKKYDPGKWGPAAAGTVEEDETYEQNIIKEAKEEIGLEIDKSKLITGPKVPTKPVIRYFVQTFFYKCDWPIEKFTPRKEEVAAMQWIHIDKLIKWAEEKPEELIWRFRGKDSLMNEYLEFRHACRQARKNQS